MGSWQINQNSSHIETRSDLARSTVVCVQCDQNKAKQQWDVDKPKIQASRQMKKITIFFPDEAEEFDAVVQNARKKMEIPVELAMPCVTRVRIPTAKAPTQKVAE